MTDLITVSYSELDTYRQCPLKHAWAYKHRWRKPVAENSALAKGSLWHLVMETHYNVIKEHPRVDRDLDAAILQESLDAIRPLLFNERTGDHDNEVQELIHWMFRGYVDQWGLDPDWDIIEVEGSFLLPLLDPDGVESPYLIKGKLDLLVRDRQTGHLWVVDHKSGANLPTMMDLEIDDQFGLYSWAMKQKGTPVLGAIHNAARTTRNVADQPGYTGKSQPQSLDQRHLRSYLNRTETELDSIAIDAWAVAANAYPTGEALPLYSAPDPRQCGWKCDFKEVHLMSRKGRDPNVAFREMGFEQDFTRH